jgi:hypothetical protein
LGNQCFNENGGLIAANSSFSHADLFEKQNKYFFFFYNVNKAIQDVVVLPTQKQVTRFRQQAEQILF